MLKPTVRSEASLPEFLVARARAMSDGRLVVDVVAGLLAGLAVAAWRPFGWISLLGVCLVLAAFGLWGILDRELRERVSSGARAIGPLLRGARAAVAVLGFIGAAAALFAGLGAVLGTWIS